jgi:hypothetical protein
MPGVARKASLRKMDHIRALLLCTVHLAKDEVQIPPDIGARRELTGCDCKFHGIEHLYR